MKTTLLQTLLAGIAWLALALASVTPIAAHSFELTRTLLLLRADGSYQVDITCDLDALALGVSPTVDSTELALALLALSPEELEREVADLERTFQRRVRVRFDGEAVRPRVSFPHRGAMDLSHLDQAPGNPTAGDPGAEEPGPEDPRPEDPSAPVVESAEGVEPTVLGLVARLEGQVPEGASEITFSASRGFPPVHLTLLDERQLSGRRQLLEPGAPSLPYLLTGEALEGGGGDVLPVETAGRYLALGFWHIVPEGLDHILFVLGLFLLSARWRPLLWQVSAFTLAHTLTLALSTYGVVRLPPEIVEPLIALSIAYVAIENLLTSELKPWRPVVVFAFGLLHGLGFAGVLGELGLPQEQRFTALLAFNVGVELGQLAVLLAAFALVGWLRDRPQYRRWVVIPGSIAIALMGLYWAVERVSGG